MSEKWRQSGSQSNTLHHGLDQLMHKITSFKKSTRDEPGNQASLLLCFLDNHEHFQNVFSDLINLKVSVHNLNASFDNFDETSVNVVSLLLLKNAYEEILGDLNGIIQSLTISTFYKNFVKEFSCQNVLRASLAPSEPLSVSNPKLSDNSVKLDIKDQGIHEYLLENNSQKHEISPFNKTRKNNILFSEPQESKLQTNSQEPKVELQNKVLQSAKPTEEFLKPTVLIPESRVSSKTPYLSIIAELSKQNKITQDQKVAVKNLIIQDNLEALRAFKSYMDTKDQDQLLKILNVLCPK